jgi:putative membrane protein
MGYGGMGWMPIMGIFWLIVLGLIVAALMGAFRVSEGADRRNRGERRSSGLAILEERYARGEINREEYLQKKQDILG